MMKIGLRAQNWPSDAEKGVLIEHIWKEYGGHSIEEIKLAFDMAIAGKLDVEVNCYENFSCLYFSNIMSAYRAWSKEEYKQIPKVDPDPTPAPEADISDEAMEEWCRELKARIIDGKSGYSYMPIMLYDWLVENGRLFKGKGEKKEYLHKAIQYRQGELTDAAQTGDIKARVNLNEFMAMKDNRVLRGDVGELVVQLAKRMILFDFLKDEL